MIGRIYAIALNTFREAIRKRMLYAIIVLVIGANLFSIVMGAMSFAEEARVARDIGLASISLFGSITAIILGSVLLHSEIQRRTIHTIIAKPIERYEFVLGKYLGMVATLTVLVALFTLALAGLLYYQNVPFSTAVLEAVLLRYIEVLVVAAIAVLFSSMSSPVLAGLFTTGLWLIGKMTPEMTAAVESAESEWTRRVCSAALRVVPDLHLTAISGSTVDGEYVSVHDSFVGWDYVAAVAGHGLLYVAAFLFLAVIVFSRRDFV